MKRMKIIALFLVASVLLSACSTAAKQENEIQGTIQETTLNETTPNETSPNETTPSDSKANEIVSEEVVTKEISSDATNIVLSDDGITVDGVAASTDTTAAVYTSNDIIFYLEGQDFTYGEGTKDDEHSQEEADEHTVVYITKPGEYVLSGSLSAGQIAVDLGEDAKTDPNAVVTLVLDGVDVTCTVAPAVIFYNVYECGSTDLELASMDVDTTTAGANVIIADGSENNIHGSYVARIYKSVELNEEGTEIVDSKKLHKYDGAFYSKMSMNLYGGQKNDGILNIYAENEGLDSELHLTLYSGNINIESGNDGINANEDGISVVSVRGGTLNIVVNGSTGEGDGIDSNGWLVVDGGNVNAAACAFSADAGIDSDMGIYIRGGQVVASGNMFDRIEGGQTYAVFTFTDKQKGGQLYSLKTETGDTVISCSPSNDFKYLILSNPSLTAGNYTFWQGESKLLGSKGNMQMGGAMPQNMGGERPDLPEGMEMAEGGFPEMPEGTGEFNGERPEPPEGMEMPESMEGLNGERPEPPEGMEQAEGTTAARPNRNPGGIPGMNMDSSLETDSVFVITEGSNFFQIAAE